MVAKWGVFSLLYQLAKGYAIVSITRNLVVKYLLNLKKTTLLRFSKVVVTPAGNVFVQNGDPSQDSKAAKNALDKIGAVQFSIPPRSPDLNPIENAFNLVEKKIK